MDICSHIGFSVNGNTRLNGLCIDILESTYGFVGDYVDELAYGATRFLNIHDDEEGVLGSIPPHECGEAHQDEIVTEDYVNLFGKSSTCPCSSTILSPATASIRGSQKGEMNDADAAKKSEFLMDDDGAESVDPHCSSAPSLPNPLKPVSAMKGSREKRGVTPHTKLMVTWAPDVYDPVPTPPLHIVNNKPHRHGKKKSKTKPKSGSKGKEKKKSCSKTRGRPRDMGFKWYEPNEDEDVLVVSEMNPSAIDIQLGIPDLFCGSSFVDRYGSSLHLSSANLGFRSDTYPFDEIVN